MSLPGGPADGFLSILGVPPRQSLGKRVKDMALLWAFFGVVVGIVTMRPGWALIPITAGVIAGLLVLTPLGLLLGLIGARARLALLGGLCGAALGGLLGLVATQGGVLYAGSVGLISGALAGATLSLMRSWLSFLASLRDRPLL